MSEDEYTLVHDMQSNCKNVSGFCEICDTPMVGHLMLVEHQMIVRKNEVWWHEFRMNRDSSGDDNITETNIAIGCKLDPSDKSIDAERRYVEVKE